MPESAPDPAVPARCAVCGRSFPPEALRPAAAVRPGILQMIRREHPVLTPDDRICREDLSRFRRQYLEDLLEEERGELSDLDREVIQSLETGTITTQNPELEFDEHTTFGQRMADHVANFGGSWAFILTFLAVLVGWIILNSAALLVVPFDPYPYILLNLVLSCIAAVQAPVIMMSQKRQEQKDRLRSQNDYQVNLKAELEIRQLRERLDYQMARQWEKLAELQRLQIEYLEARQEDDEDRRA